MPVLAAHIEEEEMELFSGAMFAFDDDEWELYDLTADPIEADNRWHDPSAAAVAARLVALLDAERARCVPPLHDAWPYAVRAAIRNSA